MTSGPDIGADAAIFEAVHGSDPDLAGKNLANPLALLMSAILTLEHVATQRDDARCRSVAHRITQAYRRALADGEMTRDLGGKLGTQQFAEAVT